MSSPTGTGTGAISAAMVLAFSYGGVTLEHLLLGVVCFMIGAGCRFGLKVATELENGRPPQVGRALAAFSVSPLLGAFASMALYFGAHIIGFEGDAAIGLLLALSGFRGPEGIQTLASFVSNLLPDKLKKAQQGGGQESKP